MLSTKLIYQCDFLKFEKIENTSLGLISAKKDYIPIENFKIGFSEISKHLKDQGLNSIIFDKRNLTVFHQPSMEWYYTSWKMDLIEVNVRRHYKILPALPWFEKSVEAGKNEIKANHPDFDFSQFTVTYVTNPEEAVKIEASTD